MLEARHQMTVSHVILGHIRASQVPRQILRARPARRARGQPKQEQSTTQTARIAWKANFPTSLLPPRAPPVSIARWVHTRMSQDCGQRMGATVVAAAMRVKRELTAPGVLLVFVHIATLANSKPLGDQGHACPVVSALQVNSVVIADRVRGREAAWHARQAPSSPPMVLGPVSLVETVLLAITATRVKAATMEPAPNVNLPHSRPRRALGLALHARAVPLDTTGLVVESRPEAFVCPAPRAPTKIRQGLRCAYRVLREHIWRKMAAMRRRVASSVLQGNIPPSPGQILQQTACCVRQGPTHRCREGACRAICVGSQHTRTRVQFLARHARFHPWRQMAARTPARELVAPMRPIAATFVGQDFSSMRQRATVIRALLRRFSRALHLKELIALHAQTKQCRRHRRAQM